jgi:hypothetical protein
MRHCQLGPESSVHKNVDNLTTFRINVVFRLGSNSRTRNPEFHFMERRRKCSPNPVLSYRASKIDDAHLTEDGDGAQGPSGPQCLAGRILGTWLPL